MLSTRRAGNVRTHPAGDPGPPSWTSLGEQIKLASARRRGTVQPGALVSPPVRTLTCSKLDPGNKDYGTEGQSGEEDSSGAAGRRGELRRGPTSSHALPSSCAALLSRTKAR